MREGGESRGGRRVVYCIVPRELVEKAHEPLRRYFAEEGGGIEVVVERRERGRDRRGGSDRRAPGGEPPDEKERRAVLHVSGRRIAERRAALVPARAPELPRRLRRYADRLTFAERVEPAGEHAEDLDSARLVTRCQAGENEAFGTLYTRYFERVYNFLRMTFNDHDEAEDGAQTVFLRALEALPRYERRGTPFRAWLFVIARNYARSQFERLQRVEPMDPAELGERIDRITEATGTPELDPIRWISDKEMLLFLERLPIPQRQVVLLRFMLGLTTAETAEVLKRTPGAIRAIQHRAAVVLRDRLKALGREPERDDGSTKMKRWLPQATVLRARRFSLWD